MISPNFFPLAGIGAKRVQGLCKSFAEQGQEVQVVSVHASDYEFLGDRVQSESMNWTQAAGVEHIAISALTAKLYERLFRKLGLFRFLWFFNYFNYWDRYSHWPKCVLASGEVLQMARNADVLLTFCGPYSGVLLSQKLKELNPNIRWVIDIRDPLTEHFGWLWPSWWHWRLIRSAENKFLRQADGIVVVTEEMRAMYARRGIKPRMGLKVIPNGFDGG